MLEKVILVEIDSLDTENHCTAGNEYFAKFCNCSESAVTKSIRKLKEKGFIEILEFDGRHRKIKAVQITRQSSKNYEAESDFLRPNNITSNTITSNNTDLLGNSIQDNKIEGTYKSKTSNPVIEAYEKLCPNLPKVRALTDARKKAIDKLLAKYDLDTIKEVFTIANDSDFLQGKNDSGWKGNLDFLLREDKFIATLEGKYSNKKQSNGNRIEGIKMNSESYTDEERAEIKRKIANGEYERI